MTRFIIALVALSASLIAAPAFACDGEDGTETASNADIDVALTYAVVSVDNVTCAGCYVPIRQELTSLTGVHTIEEGADLGKLVIGYDKNAKLTDAQFKAAIKKAGYDCSVQLTAEKPAAPAPAAEKQS